MRIIILILISFFSLSLQSPESRQFSWVVEPESRLIIDGKSNVNTFRCEVKQYWGSDTIRSIYVPSSAQFTRLSGAIEVLAKNIDCKNQHMTNDLRKTILAETHPTLKIEFLPVIQNKKSNNQKEKASIIEVSLGGVCKKFDVEYSLNRRSNGYTTLKGSRKFLFSDFNLEPPTKLLGIVKVENEFEVIFDLILKPLD